MRRFAIAVTRLVLPLSFGTLLVAQSTVLGTINGSVTDQTGALIPNAHIHVIEKGTGQNYDVATNPEGRYAVPSVPEGVYTLQASAPGFRSEVIDNAKVDVGTPITVDFKLEIGAASEKVEVQANATQVETASATVATTVTGRQIVELPFTSRDALDLALLTPGNAANGAPRESSFNGLGHNAINISMDGVNTQDDLLKSSSGGGMYTYIRPRIDAIEEFSIQSAVEGADSSGEGAVQIKFVTKRGTNDFHGGAYWYVRNTDLDANYYFNNEMGLPRQQLKLNQIGGKVGGPILKNKLFFFTNLEYFILPESNLRQRNVLTQNAASGIYTYQGSDGKQHSVNLLQLAANNKYPSTINPVINDVLTKINSLRGTGVGITPLTAYSDIMSFNTPDTQKRKFATARMDYNITDKLHFEFTYNYDYFYAFPDSLNSLDEPFPNFVTYGAYQTEGGQISNRFSGATALQWTISPTMTNEIRAGLQGGTGAFETQINPQALPNSERLNFPSIGGVTPYDPINRQPSQLRNTPVKQISDTLNWVKGNHNLSMGGNGTLISFWGSTVSGLYPGISFGVVGSDPVASIFNTSSTSMPSASPTDITNAKALYAFLTGRVSSASASEYVNENTKQYVPFSPEIERDRQHEFGAFIQDSWHYKPTLTLTGGVRWEFQGSPYDANGIYSTPTYAGLWGVSGIGNLFAPGVMTGAPTTYVSQGKPDFFNPHLNNFAPNVGLAWSPHSDNMFLKAIFGKGGAFRAGYGISFIRDGIDVFEGTEGSNPGVSATATLTSDVDFKAGSLVLGNNGLPPLNLFPSTYLNNLPGSTFTYRGVSGYAADPNLRTPYVQSWSAGIQRELNKDTVLELRYVGNHAIKLLRTYNINEVNIIENGFLQEFKNAQNNYNINQANGGVASFANRGLPGQVNTPILSAAFKGLSTASGFGNGSFITDLQQGQAGAFASSLAGSGTFLPNMISSGYPANFFQVNPTLAGATDFVVGNAGFSTYNAAQIEIRHRFSHSIQFGGSYVFSKALTDQFEDSALDNLSFVTLRDYKLNKTISPYNLTHQLKFNWIYELPFGPGHAFTTNSGLVNRIIGGWQFEGIARLQSGSPFILNTGGTRATLNQYDSGVVALASRSQIQSQIGVYKLGNGTVDWINPSFIGTDGRANPADLVPNTTPGVVGDPYFYLYGPAFIRFDLTAAKKTTIAERVNLELRAEFLDAFNNQNFIVGSPTSSTNTINITSTSFGRLTNAYQDISTTSDPGGRIIQLVVRINF